MFGVVRTRLAVLCCFASAIVAVAPRRARGQHGSSARTAAAASSEPDAADDAPTPAEEHAAQRVVPDVSFGPPGDVIAEESERTGRIEGAPVPAHADVADEIAALSDRACLRALQRASVPFERVRSGVPGIAQPIRVTGPIAGVRYRSNEHRAIHELLDCRLAVALVRFSRMLRPLGVVEVRHYSMYRPPTAAAVARQRVQTRHPGGMAIDAAVFVFADGHDYDVERDFHGRLGRPVCGPEARVPAHPGAQTLRTIACEAARRGLFTVILTPNYNYPHRNHFHMEVTRNANWRFVR